MAHTDLLLLARNQFGIVHRRQLVVDLEMTSNQVTGLRDRSEIEQVLPSTYRLASHPDTFLSRAIATQLWAGADGFVSSWSAARLYGLRKMSSEVVHFTVPERFSRRTPWWVHLDRSRWYDADDDRHTLPNDLIVASPPRMLFGLAHDVTQFRFDRAMEDAWHRKLITPCELADYLERHRCRGKNGVARIENWLERHGDRLRPAQSHLETTFLEAFERAGLPPAERQYPLTLANGELIHLDIAWPAIRLAVEPGSTWYHGGDAAQAKDHDRDLACNELGWMVVRLDETFRHDLAAAAERVARTHHRRSRELTA